jgi:hypothetical protein
MIVESGQDDNFSMFVHVYFILVIKSCRDSRHLISIRFTGFAHLVIEVGDTNKHVEQ